MQKLNTLLDRHVLPYPIKYLTNRLVILATLTLLIPLLLITNQTFVLAVNSYLNIMSVVVSSTVLLYATLAEARDREAAQRREEIARAHEAIVEKRSQADHETIVLIHSHLDDIHAEVMNHISASLDIIQKQLIEKMEKQQQEDHIHIQETHAALLANAEVNHQELTDLTELVAAMHRGFFDENSSRLSNNGHNAN